MSRYDVLHDEYLDGGGGKAGTRYERLVALVSKLLDETAGVTHDIKLIGDSQVKHQIDVRVERDGASRRILIECKDFDASGEKVGLDIVRSFWAVVDDTRPDDAMIVTCNDFTEDAQKFAKAKGIRLALLRTFTDADWEGRIREIHINFVIYSTSTPKVALSLGSQEAIDKMNADFAAEGIQRGFARGAPVFFVAEGQRVQANDFVEQQMKAGTWNKPGPQRLDVDVTGWSIEVGARGPLPLTSLAINWDVYEGSEKLVTTSNRIAQLVLAPLDHEDDFVVFDDQLRHFTIDPDTGAVRPR